MLAMDISIFSFIDNCQKDGPSCSSQDMNAERTYMASMPDYRSVAEFKPGPGNQRLDLKFDIDELQSALDEYPERE